MYKLFVFLGMMVGIIFYGLYNELSTEVIAGRCWFSANGWLCYWLMDKMDSFGNDNKRCTCR
jgi:hypothetical protein